MKTLNIKTFNSKNEYSKPHFFVLNKGLNSGKPMLKSCPNCFVFSFENEADKEFYFWISYGLWKTKAFEYNLRGSVIPFIIIRDYTQCIINGAEKANSNPGEFEKGIKLLKSLDQEELKIKKTFLLIKEARKAIFYKYLKK